MKVAIYLRVSTSDQTTLNQEIELKSYCERLDYEITDIYKDEGVSGSKTSRPELDRLLQDMRLKKFEAIIVWKLDRLGRSTQHLLQLLEEFKHKSIRLIITDMNIDTETSQGKFFFTVVGAFAELEREMIRERIYAGLERRKKQGFKLGRPKGAKDKGRRKKGGYYLRYKGAKKTPPQKYKKKRPVKTITNKEELI